VRSQTAGVAKKKAKSKKQKESYTNEIPSRESLLRSAGIKRWIKKKAETFKS
jgi:hypothetical protein